MAEEKNQPEADETVSPVVIPQEPIEPAKTAELVTETTEKVQSEILEATEVVAEELPQSRFDEIKPGMVVKVYQKIKDITSKGTEREREQFFEGIVITRKHGKQDGATITVRKISHGVGVEKIFPLKNPTITKVELMRLFKVRRSKLYFLRRGYKKRLKEVKVK